MLLMEITRDSLLKPLQSVIGIVERRHTLPILSNLFIEQSSNDMTLLATDLEIQISTRVPNENAKQNFSITVSAKKLQDICRAFSDDTILAFEKDDNKVQVKSGKSRFSLQTLPPEDFPRLSVASEYTHKIDIPQKIFKNLLNRVQYSMAQQDIRYYLNGLLFIAEPRKIRLVATDGHRLAMISEQLPDTATTMRQEVILPRKSVLELVKLLNDIDDPITIEFATNQMKFTFSDIVMVTKIVEGKFPDYNKVIPINYQNTFTLERNTLLHALQRASILSSEKFSGVRLVLTQNCIRILCSNNEQEEAQEELEIEYSGMPLDIGFNVRYLLDVLNNLTENDIVCSFGDVNSSALITLPNNDDFKYVVMPMRI